MTPLQSPDATLHRLAEIEARVRPTLRLRHGLDGVVDGCCITEADLDVLLALARAGADTPEGR